MGVAVERVGKLVSVHAKGTLQGRDAVLWADVVRVAFAATGGSVALFVEIEPGTEIPISQLTAGCRVAIPITPLIEACAIATPPGRLRSLCRCAMSAIAPTYPVAYFDDAASARGWLDRREHAHVAA